MYLFIILYYCVLITAQQSQVLEMAAPLSWVISKALIRPMYIEIGSPICQTGLKSATKQRMALKSRPS